ncbi:MAG: hypothetical protein AUF79_02470 [Crenarchaeota archaeon 13_1_20CM_2_51_8]|nr:MAG: hypothetical protein AUF79_02470 [Crenarchaeota archaeon 13_1_20CM_2_51_8]
MVSPNEASFKINVSSIDGFTGIVTLSSKAPAGVSTIINTGNPNSVILLGSSGTALLTVSSTVTGNYTVTVTGTSGQISHSMSIAVVTQGIGFTANPNPLSLFHSPGSSTVTLTSLNGLSGNLNLSAYYGRFSPTLFPPHVYLPEGGIATATVTLNFGLYANGHN